MEANKNFINEDMETISTMFDTLSTMLDEYKNIPQKELTWEEDITDEERKLLSELDAIDVNYSEMVEFTDEDIFNNAALLGQMAIKNGHANNVECNSYYYIINVYQQDAVNSTYKYTRIYEFTNNVAIDLNNLFNSANAHFIHRTTTNSFGSAHVPLSIYIEKRQINVYDLITDDTFDIDSEHYFYLPAIVNFEPFEVVDEHWSSEIKENYISTGDEYLTMKSTSPHKLKTSGMIYLK